MKYTISLILLSLLCSCGVSRSMEIIEPMSMPPPRKIENVKVALVLGGGGARGAAHAGVLEVLEKAGVPIDMIVGCSAGAIVGSMYADKQNATYLKEAFLNAKREDMLDFTLQNIFQGPVKGHSLERFMLSHLDSKNIEELSIPTVILTTDLHEGAPVWISSGPIAPAVVASSALPPVFSPRVLYGMTLVDGGVIEIVPVSYAKAVGADVVIAVDVSAQLPASLPKHILGVTKRSMEIALNTLSKIQLRNADIVLRPKVEPYGLFDDKAAEIYLEGVESCQEQLGAILQLLERKGIPLKQAELIQTF